MEKLTSIWQIDEIIVDEIARLTKKEIKFKNKYTNKYEKRFYTYSEILSSLLIKYEDLLKSYTRKDDGKSLWDEDDIKKYVNKLKLSLKWLFTYYQKGNLIESNRYANRLFNVTANRFSAKSLFPVQNIKKDTFWFRAREPEEKRFKRKDLFHVPFEMRGKISTNRYSLPGYPCLYLASSMECAKKEVGNKGIMAISCFQNITDIEAYDFTFFPLREKEDWQSLYNDIMAYPLKIAASIPTERPKDKEFDSYKYKEEYVIPQLLLHCVVRQAGNRRLAILYSSVKSIYEGIPKEEYHKHVNIVIPALLCGNMGYCEWLINIFRLTEPQIVPFSYLNNGQIEMFEEQMKNDKKYDVKTELMNEQ